MMKEQTSKELEYIALKYLDIVTLETQNSDRLDFHEVSVWEIKEALKAAYYLGVASANGDLEL
jgi:hypothetical protein